MYPPTTELAKVNGALVVCRTFHLQTPLPTLEVLCLPIRLKPLVHNCPPNLRPVGTPPRRHLQVIKCIPYKNIKLSECNLRKMN
jgi:hypothetical protein